jgi:hypothetical protein
MKIQSLAIFIVSLMFVINCGDKGTSNSNPDKEIARIFFLNDANIDTEEVVGDVDNRITCKQSLGPGIRVLITDEDNRSFRLDFEFVTNTGFIIKNGYAKYTNVNGTPFESNGYELENVEIFWRENLEMCEFTFKTQNPIRLTSNTAQDVLLDSIRIETLREDD